LTQQVVLATPPFALVKAIFLNPTPQICLARNGHNPTHTPP
jgi:hypothetical protein